MKKNKKLEITDGFDDNANGEIEADIFVSHQNDGLILIIFFLSYLM